MYALWHLLGGVQGREAESFEISLVESSMFDDQNVASQLAKAVKVH